MNSSAEAEVNSEGLTTAVLPAASAADSFQDSNSSGEFQGMIMPITPERFVAGEIEDAGLVGRNDRALDLVGQAAVVAIPLGHVLGLAAHLRDQLAVVAHLDFRQPGRVALDQVGQPAEIILEPKGRNTAPAVALAAFLALERNLESGAEPVLLVMPADHVIGDLDAFQRAVALGRSAATDGRLVTFGIVPTRAETGFGYVQASRDGDAAVAVRSFVEKPDAETARAYVDGGEHFWNSGMFLFGAKTYLDALRSFEPAMHEACEQSMRRRSEGDFIRPDADTFLQCPGNSIDYAVMEKTTAASMVPLDAGWSDVGSWAALHDVSERDADGNAVDGDVVVHECRDSYIRAESRLVAAGGLDGVVVVETRDSVLVTMKDRAQDVKAIVDRLEAGDREETRLHRRVFRPWGSYDSLEDAEGFRVKHLVVNPGAELSLQKHARRAEHWVVVKGKARITRNDDVFDLGVNESTDIAIGDVHRIANPFDTPAHVVEVQCGDYLGEDDIVRLEDNYGREGSNS